MTSQRNFVQSNFLPKTAGAQVAFKSFDELMKVSRIQELRLLADDLENMYTSSGVLGIIAGPVNLSFRTIMAILNTSQTQELLCGTVEEKLQVMNEFESSFIRLESLRWEYKNVCQSLTERKSGNEQFKNKKWTEALMHYNNAAVSAPVGSQLEALAIGNRSAVLAELELEIEAARDGALALSLNCPDKTREKIIARLTRSLQKLSAPTSVFLSLMDSSVQKHNDLFKTVNDFCSASIANEIPVEIRSIVGKETLHIKNGFDKDALHNGNGVLRAMNPMRNSTMIFFTHTLKVVPSPTYKLIHCHNCSCELVRAIACAKCTQVRFCSEDCHNMATTFYHGTECSLLQPMLDTGFGFLGFALLRYAALAKSGYLKNLLVDNWIPLLKVKKDLMLKINIVSSLLVFYIIDCLRSVKFFDGFGLDAPPSPLPGYTATEYFLMKSLLAYAYEVLVTYFPVFEEGKLVAICSSSPGMNALLKADATPANSLVQVVPTSVLAVFTKRTLEIGEAVVVDFVPLLPNNN